MLHLMLPVHSILYFLTVIYVYLISIWITYSLLICSIIILYCYDYVLLLLFLSLLIIHSSILLHIHSNMNFISIMTSSYHNQNFFLYLSFFISNSYFQFQFPSSLYRKNSSSVGTFLSKLIFSVSFFYFSCGVRINLYPCSPIIL